MRDLIEPTGISHTTDLSGKIHLENAFEAVIVDIKRYKLKNKSYVVLKYRIGDEKPEILHLRINDKLLCHLNFDLKRF